jgi:hypothetical protein
MMKTRELVEKILEFADALPARPEEKADALKAAAAIIQSESRVLEIGSSR